MIVDQNVMTTVNSHSLIIKINILSIIWRHALKPFINYKIWLSFCSNYTEFIVYTMYIDEISTIVLIVYKTYLLMYKQTL